MTIHFVFYYKSEEVYWMTCQEYKNFLYILQKHLEELQIQVEFVNKLKPPFSPSLLLGIEISQLLSLCYKDLLNKTEGPMEYCTLTEFCFQSKIFLVSFRNCQHWKNLEALALFNHRLYLANGL